MDFLDTIGDLYYNQLIGHVRDVSRTDRTIEKTDQVCLGDREVSPVQVKEVYRPQVSGPEQNHTYEIEKLDSGEKIILSLSAVTLTDGDTRYDYRCETSEI